MLLMVQIVLLGLFGDWDGGMWRRKEEVEKWMEGVAVGGGFEIAVTVHYPWIVCLRMPSHHNEYYRSQTSQATKGVKAE